MKINKINNINKIFPLLILILSISGYVFNVEAAQDQNIRVIHTLVALCDNQYQGIVPVPAKIGNGDDPFNNLYWGAGYGVKTYFKRSKEWQLISEVKNPKPAILERVIFKYRNSNIYLVADAYRGREIKQCTIDLLEYSAGKRPEQINVKISRDNKEIRLGIGGSADLITYTGHNGLMDFKLDRLPAKADQKQRDIVILACASRNYFQKPVIDAGAKPILLTTGFMAPEAYVLEAAVNGWIRRDSLAQIRLSAATAYHKYQKCGMRGAKNLFAN